MNWDLVQQLIRIVMNFGGAAVLGDAIANGELYQGAVGGVVALAAFVWWYMKERGVVR